jgi:lactoylglutathione lyase
MAKAVHTMIRVLDERRSLDFYRRAFELEVADRFDFADFTLVYLSNSEAEFEVELTVNKGRSEAYDLGNGYGHIAFTVDDLEAAHARMSDAGFAPRDIKVMEHDGATLARYFFVSDPDGYQIEILERRGRFR